MNLFFVSNYFKKTFQFDKVVRDYQRVVQVREANVPLVSKVLQSIHKIVDDFRQRLKLQLEDHDVPIEDQESVIQ